MLDPLAPTQRFGDRAEAYARHRPGDPPALPAWLRGLGRAAGCWMPMWRAPGHDLVADALFARDAVAGAVDLDYDTRVFVGTLH